MKNLAIIPARSGSKRLPGKNIKDFNGLPLIVHSINYAKKQTDIINHIVVSTDDEVIKNIALKHNIEVIDRPEQLSRDTSTSLEAIIHTLNTIQVEFDNVILLQPTNPLRPENLLREAYKHYLKNNHDSLFTVTKISRKIGRIKDNRYNPVNYTIGQTSQEIEPLFFENGLLYIAKVDLIKTGLLLSKDASPFLIEHPYSKVDIDTQEDFEFALGVLRNTVKNEY